MKHIKNIIFITGFLIVASSCSIDNVEPNNLLLETTVISDENTAENVLNLIYKSGLRNSMYDGGAESGNNMVDGHQVAGQYLDYVANFSGDIPDFNDNNVTELNGSAGSFYSTTYYNINVANFFIEALERGDANVSADRRDELLAEAKFFRGLSHFNLLRIFGQFYDLTSEYGVVISEKPIRTNAAFSRKNVADSYESIIKDLEFATAKATTDVREHHYVTATTAQGLLARVQLYKQDYTNAAINALAVINNTSGYSLDPSYANIFSVRFGTESLLATFIEDNVLQGQAAGNTATFIRASPDFVLLANKQDGDLTNGDGIDPITGELNYATGYDPRFSFSFDNSTATRWGKYPEIVNLLQILRMGEIYLIHAEAETRRPNGVLTVALASLNAIRSRVGVPDKTSIVEATLLEDIREEKVLELYGEVAEHWFDLVRYHSLGNIDALTVKPSLTSVHQFILPIPLAAIEGNSNIKSNPL